MEDQGTVLILLAVVAVVVLSSSSSAAAFFAFGSGAEDSTSLAAADGENKTSGDLSTSSTSNTSQTETYRYHRIPMVDWVGNDIRNIQATSVSTCETQCDADSSCKYFFAKMPGEKVEQCWLKKGPLDPNSRSYIKEGDWNAGSFFVKPGADIPLS